ncbi:MAG: thrombospondin type 3 repeat-containing protein, partial [Phycisphaerales bacterium]
TGLSSPGGIALEPAAGKMYWADFVAAKIQRANLDGTGVEDLVTTGLITPEMIALALPTSSDTDADGVMDECDGCPNDVNKTVPGICGCGAPDTDSDGDGLVYCLDNCPNDLNPLQEDADGNAIGDACEPAGCGACGYTGLPILPLLALCLGWAKVRRRHI